MTADRIQDGGWRLPKIDGADVTQESWACEVAGRYIRSDANPNTTPPSGTIFAYVNRNFQRPFWEDSSEYLKRSPIMYVGKVKTPTMLMTGVLDLRTPMPQTEEFYEALKYCKVPTAMIRFNEEWHGHVEQALELPAHPALPALVVRALDP